jgi:D-sedoheptulose 7-phosphate isomerase
LNTFLHDLCERHSPLRECAMEIEDAFKLLVSCYHAGNKVLICGNGGSAADAEHWSAELMKGFYKKRPLRREYEEKLSPDLAMNLQGALPTIPLTGFFALSTAFANDNNGEYLFSQLVLGLGKAGDTLIAISTSGNSLNTLHAVQTASALGMATLGLTGRDGGRLAGLTDVCIRVPARDVHLIQEYHLPVYHTLSLMLEDEFFGKGD